MTASVLVIFANLVEAELITIYVPCYALSPTTQTELQFLADNLAPKSCDKALNDRLNVVLSSIWDHPHEWDENLAVFRVIKIEVYRDCANYLNCPKCS